MKVKKVKELLHGSEFTKNVLTLVSGTAFAQIIPFVIAPVLSRIYAPEDFGLLAIYMAIVQTLITVSTGRYEMAIMLPGNDRETTYTTLLSMIIAIGFSCVLFLVAFVFGNDIALLIGDGRIRNWLYLVPVSVLLISVYNCLNYFNLKKKKFRTVAVSKVYKSTGEAVSQGSIGWFNIWDGGLIIGYFISHITGNLKMVGVFLKEKKYLLEFTSDDFLRLTKRFKIFPIHSLPSILFNTASIQIPTLFISRNFSLGETGFYSFAFKYITAPMNLVGTAIGQVFFQQLADKKEDTDQAKKIFVRTFLKLLAAGLMIFVPLFFLIVPLFGFIFGEHWMIAGEYGKILLPLIFVRFIVSPLTMSNIVYEAEKKTLRNNLVLFGLTLLSIFLTLHYGLKIEEFLYLLTYSMILGYLYFLKSIWDIVKNPVPATNN